MACTDQIFVGDEGTSIEFEVYECDTSVDPAVSNIVDISTSTAREVIFLKPDGTTSTGHVGTFLTDGTDGIIKYITVVGDIDQAGPWKAQARITTPNGKWYSSKVSFTVAEPL